ncbi:hypothetical protein HHI36_013253 [Cryptolaemus montrouzieri]|uniref:DDE-1 domain-containing protein n=1 Tax=Cryptolaemus montrouzieri TaxID=559131 RepID=A0ABD2NGQ9_9CUCU
MKKLFLLNPKGTKVLAAKEEKSVYQKVNLDKKECYIVLLGGNAVGDVLPPMVIFKYERIRRGMSVPKSWGIVHSDNGWMTRETFFFRSLKGQWREAVHSLRLENIDSPVLRKTNFCPLSDKVLKNTLAHEIFQSGFHKCGIITWNPDYMCSILEPPNQELADSTYLQKMSKIKDQKM